MGSCMWRGGAGAGAFARGALALALALAVVAAAAGFSTSGFSAELGDGSRVGVGNGYATIEGALIQAYGNNPQLNSQRAATRATDENVSSALAGYRPRVTGTSSLTEQYLDTLTKSVDQRTGAPTYTTTKG